MVVVRPPDGAADQEAPVAAANVDDDRGAAPEKGGPVERPLTPTPLPRGERGRGEGRQFLESGPRPLLRRQDFARDGDAELALDAAVAHEGIVAGPQANTSSITSPPLTVTRSSRLWCR